MYSQWETRKTLRFQLTFLISYKYCILGAYYPSVCSLLKEDLWLFLWYSFYTRKHKICKDWGSPQSASTSQWTDQSERNFLAYSFAHELVFWGYAPNFFLKERLSDSCLFSIITYCRFWARVGISPLVLTDRVVDTGWHFHPKNGFSDHIWTCMALW